MPALDRPRAERAILGACLIDPKIIPQVAATLLPEDFARTENRRFFDALRDADHVDLPTIADAAGWEVIDAAALLDDVVSSAAWAFYAKKLTENRQRASILGIATNVAARTKDPAEQPSEIAKKAVDELLGAVAGGLDAKSVTGGELVYPVLEDLDRRSDLGFDPGPRFGLEALDDLVGGFGRSELVLIAARPSVGKTALALQLALHAVREGRRVSMASLEMSRKPIGTRLLVQMSKTSLYRALKGRLSPSEAERMASMGEELAKLPIALMDDASASVASIQAEAERYRADLVVIDYLQLIVPEASENRNEEVSKISRALKRMAMRLNVPVVALSQLKRPDTPRLPRLTDLRDSGSLEQDADIVVMLHDDPARPKERQAIVAKHRNGPTGMVSLFWDGDRCLFGNLALPRDRNEV